MNRKEAFATFNLSEDASLEVVKKTYRRLAFEMHPDLHPDKPEMARRFQLLNEAYIILTKTNSKDRFAQADADTEKARADASKAYAEAKRRFGDGRVFNKGTKPKSENSSTQATQKTQANNSSANQNTSRPKTSTFKTPEQKEVFRQTLKDPFARSVFKEIYQQLKEEKGRKHIGAALEKTPVGKVTTGVVGALKGWLKRQIDDTQDIFIPSAILLPGQKLRFQIRQGISGELKTIELVLPPDYNPDKPIRLKGLGKKVGAYTGDLYLKVYPQALNSNTSSDSDNKNS
ncbi:J domain-containing protein [Desulfovibrio litoralis]|uniref:Molecular chaperone DnaJ n=1 Tax=Desulfovibrio litoralis DSM 11393 TaxID=1121455 RepID=A0A1M7SAE6_9BACT|nr:J domain-containing protein [Desulfovibrio litoralis]SHN55388.1 molecular chaperone DnaJ [Desulfovibrio litoralis DSM 11393]